MTTSRHAAAVRAPVIDADTGRPRHPVAVVPVPTVVLPLARAQRYRGRLRRLAEPAPVALRERIVRELRGAPER